MNRPCLNLDSCRQRQQRLRQQLLENDLEAALLTDPRHVHYFTGFWTWYIASRMVLIQAEGPTILVVAAKIDEELAVDEQMVFEATVMCTLVEDPQTVALQSLCQRLGKIRRVGFDQPCRVEPVKSFDCQDLNSVLLSLRRKKDPDEVQMIHHAVKACNAAYALGRDMLKPGVTEVALYANMQAAATKAAGEPIGEFGYDFRSGEFGGAPRIRPAQSGELIVLDMSVEFRGYRCDQCRTFAVSGEPTERQAQAHERVCQALHQAEQSIAHGVSCTALWHDADRFLNVDENWRFDFHLGHGIGLSVAESPRINPCWDDVFCEGDVFTLEPGLYGADIRAAVAVENNYVLTNNGLNRLSDFPLDL